MYHTLGPEAKIKRVDGGASDDGLNIMLNVITADSKSHSFWMANNDLEHFVVFVIGLSQQVASASGKISVPEGPETRTARPIEGVAVSITPGRVEAEGLLAVHLGTFPLTFALSANALQGLYDRLGHMLHPTEAPKSH